MNTWRRKRGHNGAHENISTARRGGKHSVALVASAAVIGGILLAAKAIQPGAAEGAASPRGDPVGCVSAMIAAEQSGDVAAYLSCFAGRQREKLGIRMAPRSAERNSQILQSRGAEMTGHVIAAVEYRDRTSATLILERIYRAHIERYQIELKHVGGNWALVDMTPLQRYAPEIPYGTPVAPAGRERSQ